MSIIPPRGDTPDFEGAWLEALDALNVERSQAVYRFVEEAGLDPTKQSSLALAYESDAVQEIDRRVVALKEAYAANPGGDPSDVEWPGDDR